MDRRELYVILVCGGRDYSDRARLYAIMDAYLFLYGGDVMIWTGAARGADLMAEGWARERELIYTGFPAQWSQDGKRAGMRRNAEMASYDPNLVVAFRGGRGTRNMANTAEGLNIPVHRWDWET